MRRRLSGSLDRFSETDRAGAVDRCEPDAGRGDRPSRRLLLPMVLPRRAVGRDDVFLEIGSGGGRVVLQAARHYRFRRVIGVERSEELNAVARAKLAASRHRLRCQDVQFITASATTMTVPDDVTIAWLYDPFRASTFDMAVDLLVDLVERRERGLRIVYVDPVEHDRIVCLPGVHECPPPAAWRMRLAGLPADGARSYQLWPSSPMSAY